MVFIREVALVGKWRKAKGSCRSGAAKHDTCTMQYASTNAMQVRFIIFKVSVLLYLRRFSAAIVTAADPVGGKFC
jgi:hypothetical protein